MARKSQCMLPKTRLVRPCFAVPKVRHIYERFMQLSYQT